MNDSAELLMNIGLSEKEAFIYMASLKLGSNPASVIAKYADINRCTTYSILESLIKKGLVSDFEKAKVKYFTALPPQNLLNYIDEKRRDLGFYKNELSSNLSKFETLTQKENAAPAVQSYTGKSGINKLYNSLIREETLMVSAVHSKECHEFFMKFVPYYLRENKSVKIIKHTKNSTYKFEIKKRDDLVKTNYIQPVEFITGKKIILASVSEPYGVEITNPEIVKYFRNKFDLTWKN